MIGDKRVVNQFLKKSGKNIAAKVSATIEEQKFGIN
jgi:hypothetical protein